MGKIMTRSNKKPSRGTKPKNTFSDYTFVNYTLGKSEKEACKAWVANTEIDVLAAIDELTQDGYKLSMSFDLENSTAYVTMTNKSGPESFRNKVLSMRARDVISAFERLLWLHAVEADSDWNNLTSEIDGDIW